MVLKEKKFNLAQLGLGLPLGNLSEYRPQLLEKLLLEQFTGTFKENPNNFS